MTNDETMTKHEARIGNPRGIIRASSFGFPSPFVIRASSFSSRSAHTRNFRECENAAENLFARRIFNLVDTDRLSEIETTGFCAPQRFQVCAATELLADVMHICANIKTLAAKDAEVDFRQRDSIDTVTINMNEARLALDYFSLARQFVEWHTAMFFGRDHGRHLIEIAEKFFKSGPNLILSERRHVA